MDNIDCHDVEIHMDHMDCYDVENLTNNMDCYDAEILLSLARLLDFHYPWKTEDLHNPDYREVNDYIFNMSVSFKNKYGNMDWEENDMLNFLNAHLLEYCKSNPFSWELAE